MRLADSVFRRLIVDNQAFLLQMGGEFMPGNECQGYILRISIPQFQKVIVFVRRVRRQ
jgi:hypothetical protein